jgi:hypothetical protein
MRKWLMIGGAGAVVGYAAVYFALGGLMPKSAPEPQAEVVVPAPQPAEPVVLSHVVEVTPVDPLLDPLPGQPAGIPFDPTEPLEPAVIAPAPPPSAREIAPMPHEVNARPPLDGPRVRWYGEEVMHRQLYDWLNDSPRHNGNGIGYFF